MGNRYEDNAYFVNAYQEGLWVIFDGKNTEISGSALLRSRSCGLCGDLNGENTADLKTPERCIMSRPRLAAYSYMIQEASCAGIPAKTWPSTLKKKLNVSNKNLSILLWSVCPRSRLNPSLSNPSSNNAWLRGCPAQARSVY